MFSPSLKTLSSATGWAKTSLGQWVSLKNAIPYRDPEKGKYTDANLGADNFTKVELRTVKIGDTTFPVILFYHRRGLYRYEAISEGWMEIEECQAFVLKSWPVIIDDTKKDNESYVVDLPVHVFAAESYAALHTANIGQRMAEHVANAVKDGEVCNDKGQYKSKYSHEGTVTTKMSLLLFPVNDEGTRKVRFLLYTSQTSGYISDGLRRSGRSDYSGTERIKRDTAEFNERYFELPRTEFIEFFGTDPMKLIK